MIGQESFVFFVVLGPKLLDLDLMNGVTSEEGDSELSLKVDLQHFGEVCILHVHLYREDRILFVV